MGVLLAPKTSKYTPLVQYIVIYKSRVRLFCGLTMNTNLLGKQSACLRWPNAPGTEAKSIATTQLCTFFEKGVAGGKG